MTLNEFWFLIIGVLWAGFLVLEGFDFGVGALLPTLGKGRDASDSDKRRRLMLTTIGPHWDGNEVWLLTAGGATLNQIAEANDVLVQAGSASIRGDLATGRSRIRCESGSLDIRRDLHAILAEQRRTNRLLSGVAWVALGFFLGLLAAQILYRLHSAGVL